MKDYFDFMERIENEDTYERMENRSRYDLNQAIDYDYGFINKLLNKGELSDPDKYNIAAVVGWYMSQFLDTCNTTKSFDDFIQEVMGDEWYSNMTSKWLARMSREMAKQFGMPEMADNRNIIMFNKGEDK